MNLFCQKLFMIGLKILDKSLFFCHSDCGKIVRLYGI